MNDSQLRDYINQLMREKREDYKRESEQGDRLGAMIARDAYIDACKDIIAGMENYDD